MLGNSECYPLLPIRLKGGHVNRQGQYYGMTVAVQERRSPGSNVKVSV